MKYRIFLYCSLLLGGLHSQTRTTLDTIVVLQEQYQFDLQHPFIIDSTFQLFHNGIWVNSYRLDPVLGRVNLSTTPENSSIYIASYQYLINPLPIKVGPGLNNLPLLDSLIAMKTDSVVISLPQVPLRQESDSELISSGTIYRNIGVSPFGGTDFSGGLRLQLQGKLTSKVQVSGVLSDQSLPVQPEGTTQSLDEIDKVYLQVIHPNVQVVAGDIDFDLVQGKYLNINRKLTGLKNDFNYNNWSGKAVFAGSKGRYHQLLFYGSDGNQGPYFLLSESGSRDIIVLAGTEKVWLNGEALIRGENNDYIIDYSTGEIFFTAKRLIYFDSEIYVEYQYSDFKYNRNVLGTSINRLVGKGGQVGLSWIKEYDRFSQESSGLSTTMMDSLRVAGDAEVVFNSAVEDPDGDYILENNVYKYSPNASVTRYSVTFRNDGSNGSYIRKVTSDGQLYFEFIPESQRFSYQDLYSPTIRITPPESQDVLNITGNYIFKDNLSVNIELALSDFDQNIESSMDDKDNRGQAHRIELRGQNITLPYGLTFDYSVKNWERNKSFHALQRDRYVNFSRDWNVYSEQEGKEMLSSGEFTLGKPDLGNTMLSWYQYESGTNKRNRFQANISGGVKYAPVIKATYNQVQSLEGLFFQTTGYLSLLPGSYHPFFSYNGEYQENNHRFDHVMVGVNREKERSQFHVGLGKRVDRMEIDSTRMGFEPAIDGIFGELDFSGKNGKGWTSDITLRKRVKTDYLSERKVDYELARIKLNYFNSAKPFRWDLQTKLEESFTESRAIVYDSVGTGLGTHRYDPNFNEYIADPNGAFISYSILTGDRRPNTHFEGTQRLFIDFGKTGINIFKAVDLRIETRTDYQGTSFSITNLANPKINQTNITRSRWNIRNEIDYHPVRSPRRIRQWIILARDLNGLDPRGNDLRNEQEIGVEWYEPVRKQLQTVFIGESHISTTTSGFSLRDRSVNGWWLETGVKWRIGNEWQLDASVLGGKDIGKHNIDSFNAHSIGIKLEGLWFIGKAGRLQTRIEWNSSVDSEGNRSLPPEALNGLALGKSLRTNIQANLLLGNNLSLNTSLNYINDFRYDHLITLTGELRAYF